MKAKSFPVPADQGAISEADLDQYCRGYLDVLANNTIVVSVSSSFICCISILKKEEVNSFGLARRPRETTGVIEEAA